MLSAACPSCGAPLAFRSAAAVTVVCARCHSTVARHGEAVEKLGEIALFVRELSPLQVGARGSHLGRGFVVLGILRRERERVRWNECYLGFDDGGEGWLGESNGQYWLFADEAFEVGVPESLVVGQRIQLREKSWVVAEVAAAAITAAEGELPFPFSQGSETRYADLKRALGEGVGTIDFETHPARCWLGVPVDLVSLKMEGLRPFVGWSDPALTDFAGPEIDAVRSLRCSGCGAAIKLRVPGASARVVCEYCGTPADVDAESGEAHAVPAMAAEKGKWRPPIALGTRPKIEGVEWEIIGAMRRYVREDGTNWYWHEYLLHNPWRGFRWLVENNGHFSLVDLLAGTPGEVGALYQWKELRYRRFQGGEAHVADVAGEFTWEVARGDRAYTLDAINPPYMLSLEQTPEEQTWSLGRYLPREEIDATIAQEVPHWSDLAPHQPNPLDEPFHLDRYHRGLRILGVAVALVLGIAVAGAALLGGEVHRETLAPIGDGGVAVSSPFELPSGWGYLEVSVRGPAAPRRDGILSLVDLERQTAADQTLRLDAPPATARFPAERGQHVLRLEARNTLPTKSGPEAEYELRVERSAGGLACPLLAVLFALVAPLTRLLDRNLFESRRWSTSSFGAAPPEES